MKKHVCFQDVFITFIYYLDMLSVSRMQKLSSEHVAALAHRFYTGNL